MMQVFVIIFVCFALFGALTHAWFPMWVAILVAVCSYWAKILLDEQDKDWANDPRAAKVNEEDTLCMLTRYDCECMSCTSDPRFPDQTSKPDS